MVFRGGGGVGGGTKRCFKTCVPQVKTSFNILLDQNHCYNLFVCLQLCLAVHRHRVVECDRGCEGNDSNSSDEDENETSESGESSWEFGSLSGPFSSATGVDLR